MSRQTRTRSAGTILLSALVTALVASPVAVADRGPLPPPASPRERSADLAPALGADGTFRGAAGVAGTVETSAWTLVSDLAAGEPPRFAPAASVVSPSAAGPWSALGSNGSGDGALNGFVVDLEVSGANVYAGGSFSNPAGITAADYVARFSSGFWNALGSNGSGDGALNSGVRAVAVIGTDLYAGGFFFNAGGNPAADFIAKWNGTTWSALGSTPLNGTVYELAVSGTDLYAGGNFTNAGGILAADYVAKWDGAAWSALGTGHLRSSGVLNHQVTALEVSGTDLYVGGSFTNARLATADYVARWNGTNWFPLGSDGAGNGALKSAVDVFAVSGTDVYVGGGFSDAAGIAEADFLAKWDGTAWSAVGSNGPGVGVFNDDVEALAVYGTDLYAGGYFFDAAGVPEADGIAKWNGSTWSALGSNGSGNGALAGDADVYTLAVSGTDLYVGGKFINAGGIPEADYIAKWALPSPRKPDGRIRLRTGAFVGNNIYNTTGAGQNRSGSAARGHSVTFGISIQNDGTSADRFKVKATGSVASAYSVKYFHGTTNITAAVVAGTYRTSSLAPGATYLITATVKVKSTAAVGSKVTRLVTITSVGNSLKKDAVKLTGKRA